MKKILLLLAIFVYVASANVFAQGSITKTYNQGIIKSDVNFTGLSGYSSCPGTMTFDIPEGYWVTGVDVQYEILSQNNALISEQRSWLYCVNTSKGEDEISIMDIYTQGSYTYSRNSLNIANSATGEVTIELHVGRTWGGEGCSHTNVYVMHDTWSVTVYYELIPDCPQPTLIFADNIDANSALINWTQIYDADNWTIKVSDYPINPLIDDGNIVDGIANNNSFMLSELDMTTVYYVYIQANCEGELQSEWSSYTFSTKCGLFAVPINENFDDSNEIPLCWNYTGAGFDYKVDITDHNNYSSPNSARLYHDSYSYAILTTPEIDEDIANLRLRFYTIRGWCPSNAFLQIGTISDPSNPETFTPYSDFLVVNDPDMEWHEVIVFFDEYSGTDKFIAFKVGDENAEEWSRIFIDDIRIDLIPDCFEPYMLNASNIHINSALLSWMDDGDAISWDIKVADSNIDPETEEGNIFDDNTSENLLLISDLEPSTDYYFYVRSVCGDDNFSIWTGPYLFTTRCEAISVPITENFDGSDNIPDCWIHSGVGIEYQADITNHNNYSSPNSARLHHDSYSYVILTIPEIVEDIADTRLIFYTIRGWCPSPTSLQIGTISTPSNPETFTPYSDFLIINNPDMEWHEVIVFFDEYTGTDKFIAFKVGDENVDEWSRIFIDDVRLELIPDCPEPYMLHASNIDSNSALLSWMQNGGVTTWNVKIADSNINPETEEGNIFDETTNDNPFMLSGLDPLTDYYFYVQSDCGNDELSVWEGPHLFTTRCEAFLVPFAEDFDVSNQIPECWNTNGYNQYGIDITNHNYDSEPNSLRIYYDYSSYAMFISPEINEGISNLKLSFNTIRGWCPVSVPLQVGTISDPSNPETFTPYKDYIVTNDPDMDWHEFVVLFNEYTGIDKYIAFKVGDENLNIWGRLFLDNIAIELIPDCPQPVYIYADEISPNSAVINWTQINVVNSWTIKVSDLPIDPEIEEGNIVDETTNDNPFMLSGLDAATMYYVYIQADCEGGDQSEWSVYSFSTKCEPFIVPIEEDFDDSYEIPQCWYISGYNDYEIEINDCNYDSEPNSLRMSYDYYSYAMFISPDIDEDIANLRLSFNTIRGWCPSDMFLQIGTISDPSNPETFTPYEDFIVTNDPDMEWHLFVVLFDEYTGTDKNIAFKVGDENMEEWGRLFLDNIVIDIIPDCFEVTKIQTIAKNLDYAVLTWQQLGEAEGWNVKISDEDFDPVTEEGNTIDETTNENPFTVNELMPGTTYYTYIQTICDSENQSVWVGPYIFMTECSAFAMPFEEDFSGLEQEEIPVCWNSTHVNWGVNNSSDAGGTAPEMVLGYWPSSFDVFRLSTPYIDGSELDYIGLSFLHYLNHYSNSYYLKLQYSTDNINWNDIWVKKTSYNMPAQEFIIDISEYVAGEIFKLAWVLYGDNWNINNWNIDNIYVFERELPEINGIDIFSNVSNIEVCYGTDEGEVLSLLPHEIYIDDTDGFIHPVDLMWSIESYNPLVPDTYIATGTFLLPQGVVQSEPPMDLEVSAEIVVNDLPVVTCPEDMTVCINDEEFELTEANPVGGIYSGNGVNQGIFNPADAGAGEHIVTYNYTDTDTGCENSCEFTVTVNPLPEVNCPEDISVCIDDESFDLTGAGPEGGIYSGMGVSEGAFNPGVAGAGEHTITYTYTDIETGCENYCEFIITVNALPEMTCSEDFAVCVDAGEIELTGALPGGGIYSGAGISEGIFNPDMAGVGEHTITYTYTNPETGCVNYCEFNITVNNLPEVNCPDDFIVTENETVELTGATPEGGVYSGTGVTGGIFNPDGLANGNYTITYTYVDGNNCENNCEFIITVNIEGFPDIICPDNIIVVCANDESFALIGAMPEGGTYSGAGISDNIFSPDVAGVGEHTITYTYEAFNCEFEILVNPYPEVTCPEDIFVCIDEEEFELTGESPEGIGIYSGAGVSESMFNPATAGAGEHTITYSYTDPDTECGNYCEFVITVYALPEMTCSEDFAVCINVGEIELTVELPEGGTYTGAGISDNIFSPDVAGVGEHTITYTYTNTETGCVNSCEFNITVNDIPDVICPDNIIICINEEEFELTGAEHEGGVYSGAGISEGIFNPEVAGIGEHIITYIYTDGNECENSCEFIIIVNDIPEVTCPEDITVCIDEGEFELTGVEPEGGMYSGAGISEGVFNPAIAGAGEHIITYTYTDGNDCENSCTFIITVNALPEVNCPEDFEVTENESVELTGATPDGGAYAGAGVTNGTFYPDGLANGDYTITYTYTDIETGCSNYCEFIITVNIEGFPEIVCPEDMSVCIDNDEFVLTGASPEGGTYSGVGVTGGVFSPVDAGEGIHTITYTYGELECEFEISVYLLPTVECPEDISVCIEDGEFDLTGGEPEGGTYSGPSVSGGVFNPENAGAGEHTIIYTYTDENDCENYCEFIIIVDICPSINIGKTASVSIYPNPTNGMFVMDLINMNGKITYQIHDVKGSMIVNDEFVSSGRTQKEVNVDVAPGVYFLKLINDDTIIIEKLIIE